ncbi:hypothetical protein ACSAZK_10145 [Methanosarcina sp. Mfa9]|uniref:hypothetical protein n=1 Tax=Methanosarcina sp. Mfa9 TaxID=3439063 RepID=UPI003F87E644
MTCSSRAAGAGQDSPECTIHALPVISKKPKVHKRVTIKKAASDVKNTPEYQKFRKKKFEAKKIQKPKP